MKELWLRSWGQDRLLGRVLKNSSYLFASSVIGAVLSIVTANLLGVAAFGILGVLTSFVTNVKHLFSFRMGEVIVKYMGESLARGELDRAGAVVKAAMLIEALTNLAAFACLALVAPFAATYIAKDPATTPLFMMYGVSILAGLTTETSTGVLQVTNHYRSQALISLLQSILVAALIAWAYLTDGGLMMVLSAYLIGKIILGFGPIALAFFWLPRVLGPGWLRAPFSLLPPKRELFRFAVNTNFSSTINLIARDGEVSWVSFFFGPLAAGYFKTALAIITLIVMPINPLISTSFPEITRAFASRSWARLRSLLQRVTLVAAAWTGAVACGVILIGRQVLFMDWTLFGRTFHVYSAEYLPAHQVLLVILIGYGFANIFFWNRPLLLAEGHTGFPLKVGFWAMLAKVALAFILIKGFGAGYMVEAGLLSGYFVVTVGMNVWRGLREINRAETSAQLQGQGEPEGEPAV